MEWLQIVFSKHYDSFECKSSSSKSRLFERLSSRVITVIVWRPRVTATHNDYLLLFKVCGNCR